ncbi:hypothetical protein PC128_g11238 [Phytophthora cactorum]|nr:hypothetical protein PC128_g11238 [Phytophthora cactorum]
MKHPVFTNLPPAQQDALNKLIFLLGPEGVSQLASQGPEASSCGAAHQHPSMLHMREYPPSAGKLPSAQPAQGSAEPSLWLVVGKR